MPMDSTRSSQKPRIASASLTAPLYSHAEQSRIRCFPHISFRPHSSRIAQTLASLTRPRAPGLRGPGVLPVSRAGRARAGTPETRSSGGRARTAARQCRHGTKARHTSSSRVAAFCTWSKYQLAIPVPTALFPVTPGWAKSAPAASFRRVHDLRDAPVEAAREVFEAFRHTSFEGLGLERGDRHALTVDRVEAAKSVAGDEVALRGRAKDAPIAF